MCVSFRARFASYSFLPLSLCPAISAFCSFFNLSLHWLGSPFCSLSLILPQFGLSISGLCLCTALWDQIRFTSGLDVCSYGLLHLKGNSFSRNIGVQFETRLMLANFTPLFLQNVSSIAHINRWWKKGMCHIVMVKNSTTNHKDASLQPIKKRQSNILFILNTF